jgi:hypothetical protein
MKRCRDRDVLALKAYSSGEAEEDPSSRDRATGPHWNAYLIWFSRVPGRGLTLYLVASKGGVYLHGKRASAWPRGRGRALRGARNVQWPAK